MPIQNPVIVVPGITASQLRDEYPVTPDIVWSAVLNKEYDRITLHPDDLRYELREPSRITADALFELPYGELVSELRHNLTTRADQPVPVYPFPYDWRLPLEKIDALLAKFIQEVIARTVLMKHYHRAGYTAKSGRVDLVGHSMGGLIITGYLQSTKAKAPVDKIATLGTPFRGSYEAPIKIATGTATLGTGESSSREREAARLTPGLYHLLPKWSGALTADDGLPTDLYDVRSWQQGVIQTLAEYIRLHGLRPTPGKFSPKQQAQDLFSEMLAIANAHRKRTDSFNLSEAHLNPSSWLCIVGVDSKTRVGLRVHKGARGHPEFDLSSEYRLNEWPAGDPAQRVKTGDGTVPYLGAKPKFLDVKHLVCVRPDDFGYWEIADRSLLKVAGFHGLLPKLNLAHRLIVCHLTGRPSKSAWGSPAPDIGRRKWDPPIKGLKEKN